MATPRERVSIHGGHSGEFCSHAAPGILRAMVEAYVDRSFAWVGLTEHAPPVAAAYTMPEERCAGLDFSAQEARFARYFDTARALAGEFRDRLPILVGFESESCGAFAPYMDALRQRYEPDYIVGSVHHVRDVLFDGSAESYDELVARCGGKVTLYCEYYDRQLEMLTALEPRVVGHFDLIRKFDADYQTTMRAPEVWRRIERNLEVIAASGAILDLNLAALDCGFREPYCARPILERARELGCRALPSDDSHQPSQVGRRLEYGLALLDELDFERVTLEELRY